MRVWECKIFTDSGRSNLGMTFFARSNTVEEAKAVLNDELATVQIRLYPGQLQEVVGVDVPFPNGSAKVVIRAGGAEPSQYGTRQVQL